MTQSKNRLTAMTAIAAVLAFASPAIAQDAQPAPVSTADPLGATPPTVEPAPSTAPAPSTTVDPLSASPTVETAPAPAARARTTPRRVTRAAPPPVRSAMRARSTPRLTVAASPAPASPAPVATAPLAAPIVAARPPAAAAPTVQPPEAPPAESVSNDVLPLAAAGGLGLLALLGAGVVLRRRKRRAEEEEYVAYDEPAFEEQPVEETAYEEPRVPVAYEEPMREPSMTRAPVMATPVAAAAVAGAPLDAPANTLPDGFDLSRFGPHVQAAYRGPTEDNPSLSLKNRLRRASAMDQMVRTDGEPAQPAAARPLAASTAARDTGAVVSNIRPAPNASGFILGGDTPRPKPRPVTQH